MGIGMTKINKSRSNGKKKTAQKDSIRIHKAEGGVCPRGSRDRGFSWIENMFVNYRGGADAIESIPGYRKIFNCGDRIHTISLYGASTDDPALVIHAGSSLYRIPLSERDNKSRSKPIYNLEDKEGFSIGIGNICLISDGERLIMLKGDSEPIVISEDKTITACRCAAIYRGRLMLSGNPERAGEIFAIDIADIASENAAIAVINEGVGVVNVVSMLSHGGYLWIFKSENDGEGSIVCRKYDDGDYPILLTLPTPRPISNAIVFNGEPTIMTEEGVYAVTQPINDLAVAVEISSDLSELPLNPDGSPACLCIWCGYLALLTGGNIYLADSRAGNKYDWYPIIGVGGFKGDRRVYRYLAECDSGFDLHPCPNSEAKGEIYSVGDKGGRLIYYSVENGKSYAVYPTSEYICGEHIPAHILLCDGKYMWLCAGGGVYLFNNDRPDMYEAEAIDYYSFAGHRPTYVAITHPDSPPDMSGEKFSPGGSVELRTKELGFKAPNVVITDDGRSRALRPMSDRRVKKGDILGIRVYDQSSLWRVRQICLKSNEPFALISISYRYRSR